MGSTPRKQVSIPAQFTITGRGKFFNDQMAFNSTNALSTPGRKVTERRRTGKLAMNYK
jgi:hypothetical protein